MKESLLKYLVCPGSHEPLEVTTFEFDEARKEIRAGKLSARTSGKEFPIINYVPVFVPNAFDLYPEFREKYGARFKGVAAVDSQPQSIAEGKLRVQAGFGYEWTKYKKFTEGYDYEHVMTEVPEDFYEGKLILDAGCGFGRHMNIIRKFKGTEVIGVDFSIAVTSAMELIGFSPNVHIVQADLFNLPFRQNTFDLIYSWGVLHHTPNTKDAFFKLVPHVKDGGRFSLRVYRNIFAPAHAAQKGIRYFTSRMPLPMLRAICSLAWPVHFLSYKCGFQYVPIWSHICRFFFKFSEDWETSLNDTFDWWHPRYNHYHKKSEVRAWFEEIGFKDIYVARNCNVVYGIKGHSTPKGVLVHEGRHSPLPS